MLQVHLYEFRDIVLVATILTAVSEIASRAKSEHLERTRVNCANGGETQGKAYWIAPSFVMKNCRQGASHARKEMESFGQ